MSSLLEPAHPECIVDRRYRVRREIARGGLGLVFEADHEITGARVALKTLTRASLDHPAAGLRLLREARFLGKLRHPGVVAVHDAGTCDKHGPFAALELIDGRPLDGLLIARGVLPVGQVASVAVELCHALSYVHRHGIVHRDVKPANVLISRTPLGDRVELIDFGVARELNGAHEEAPADKLTRSGELLGTVEYMAPEQLLESAPVDQRGDVYAVGVVLYECLVGSTPFPGAATAVMANLLAGAQVPPIREVRADVPAALEAAVLRALSLNREHRFPDCASFAAACTSAVGGMVAAIDLLRGAEPEEEAIRRRREEAQTLAEPTPRKRQYVRAPYVTPVRIVLPSGAIDGRSEDISERGLLVVVDAECRADQDVEVRFPLPGTGRVAQLRARTRWVRGDRGSRAIGLELRDVPPDVRNSIAVYVAIMSAEGRPM